MMNKNILKALILTVASLSLVACGGGDEKTPTPTPTPTTPVTPPTGGGDDDDTGGDTGTIKDFKVNIVVDVNTVGEGESLSFPVTLTDANADIVTTINKAIPDNTYSVAFTQLTSTTGVIDVTVGELIRDSSTSFTINFDDTTNIINSTISINLINTSAIAILKKSESAVRNVNALLLMTPEKKLINRISELAKIVNNENYTNFSSSFSSTEAAYLEEQTKERLLNIAATLDEANKRYFAQQGSENDFPDTLVSFEQNLSALTSIKVENINHQIEQTGGLVSEIKTGAYEYSEEYDTFSLFIGNEELGSYNDDGTWVFKNEFKLLTSVVIPNIETCEAQ
ncbi:hypothetical protein JFJ09_05725 [Pseudoalteromonas arctica]|uniref:hypothetical protein n=1 Tax=Pseudoalteromonas arctica TaxID=394751 RepID=UPI001C9C4EF7|nr:hypothetical protein [Pseudoalteromonas arctica]MBZ2191712.1 hypothetical protein [Pseudoalteromonas arctica]